MARESAKPKRRLTPPERREILLDDIKDEIDRLHEIKSDRLRRDAAIDLQEYLSLHYEGRPL